MELTRLLLPELILLTGAMILFVSAFVRTAAARRFAAYFGMGTLVTALLVACFQLPGADVATLAEVPVVEQVPGVEGAAEAVDDVLDDTIGRGGDGASALGTSFTADGSLRLNSFAYTVRIIVLFVGALLLLMHWPKGEDATGNATTEWGQDAGEYFALLLLSLAGAILVAGSNDLMLLFLGIELASIPTYILISISRPLAKAQEAGVKYFFLGAVAAALMLMGFTFIYGTYGTTDMYEIGSRMAGTVVTSPAAIATGAAGSPLSPDWVTLGAVLCIVGFAFKMAAFPLHFYAGDVYDGASTPITAFLSFVPKTVGAIAIIKLLFALGGNGFAVGGGVLTVLAVMAAATMTIGNLLALAQPSNVKRVLAYSSVAHSGYLLVGLASVAAGAGTEAGRAAVSAVVFYVLAYGLMTVGSFGVLQLVPRRHYLDEPELPATGADRYVDLRGVAKHRPALGLAMAVSMFALIGIPLTVGFVGKLALLKPAYDAGLGWLVVVALINAAISAGYYLKIVKEMWLPDVEDDEPADRSYRPGFAPRLAVGISAVAVLLLGIAVPLMNAVLDQAKVAGTVDVAATPTILVAPAVSAADVTPTR